MPKLWNDTIEAHRRAVHDAILDATAALVMKHGLAAVTMSRIAEETGIGRATLYKYFSDVEDILVAWHKRQISAHLEQLGAARDRARGAAERLEAVLSAFAFIAYEHHRSELAHFLHKGEHIEQAQQHLTEFVRELIADGAKSGELRDDVPPGELAAFALHALGAANTVPSKAAVRRLVELTVGSLRK